MPANPSNIDGTEIAKFEAVAAHWWERKGALRALHDINETRVDYVERAVGLVGRRVLDVGCGGGILAESMAARGAVVSGIDMGEAPLAVARSHMRRSGLSIDYRKSTVEALALQEPDRYDALTCMELLEHVPDPASVVCACARLVRSGGHVFFATLNRTLLAGVLAIAAAEYVLGLVPRGTHTYRRFIRPDELLQWAEEGGLVLRDLSGMQYNPILRNARIGGHTRINYLAHFQRIAPSPG
ncbi:MAG: bifunctional 2-polyprenyl-6-hydroxyphenol methylase/3-demethylubiquinol 3-O-methyltransferase UbiG [Desulfobacteraceae bacterium]|nr:bifunctional 2-polyprenyl-6-hydroxyphenol methylase/3-demethylubiquinol 3-O-methyltransferase UbiG [Desulfobacteraceae bacterium]